MGFMMNGSKRRQYRSVRSKLGDQAQGFQKSVFDLTHEVTASLHAHVQRLHGL